MVSWEAEGFLASRGAAFPLISEVLLPGGVETVEFCSWDEETFLDSDEADGFLLREGTEALFARDAVVGEAWSSVPKLGLLGVLMTGESGGSVGLTMAQKNNTTLDKVRFAC